MKIITKLTGTFCLLITLLNISACDKFLDAKPISTVAVPNTLKDLQSILDQYTVINRLDTYSGELSSDDMYVTDTDLATFEDYVQRMYTWEKDYIHPEPINDWYASYKPLFTANTVLSALPEVVANAQNETEWRNIKGQAHYIRGKMFLQLAAVFALAYDAQSSVTDPGVPLRTGTDFNERVERASVQHTFDQIVYDLKQAAANLPVVPKHVIRASKPAAFGLLARTYWYMRNYEKALLYTDSCLQLKNQLLDYNTLNASASVPIPNFNVEVLFESTVGTLPSIFIMPRQKIVSALYLSYEANDLRKAIFFTDNKNGTYSFRAPYSLGTVSTILALDEVILIRAECLARTGKIAEAMSDLNTLLKKRYKTGTYTDRQASTQADALNMILTERRKELLMRGLRWMDIKRLNKEGANISLTRTVAGKTYTLPANSRRFAMPIPEDVIRVGGIEQNRY